MATDASSFHIYVDETSKSSDYFGVGAIFCRRDAAEEIAGYMSRAVLAHKQRADKEFHWTELKGHLLPLYTEVGCKLICFAQKPKPKMRYRALMVESRRIDRTIDEDANREDILAKFIFTLVYFFVKEGKTSTTASSSIHPTARNALRSPSNACSITAASQSSVLRTGLSSR